MNQEQLLERILLNMKYDSRKTLLENKETINVNTETQTYDINRKPLRFYGEIRTTIKQEMNSYYSNPKALNNEDFRRPKNLSQLLYNVCTTCGSNLEEDIKLCMAENYKYISGLNINAPFRIKRGDDFYYLWFQCRQYSPSSTPTTIQTLRQPCKDYIHGPCSETGFDELVYWNWELDKKLETLDTVKKKELTGLEKYNKQRKEKCIQSGNQWNEKTKKCEGTQNLTDFEIVATKPNKNDGKSKKSTNVIPSNDNNQDPYKDSNMMFDLEL